MKKYFKGVIALAIAITSFAFTNLDVDQFYWYIRQANGTYVADTPSSPSEEPVSVTCSSGLQICAKGFTTPPQDVITDQTTSQQTRHKSSQ